MPKIRNGHLWTEATKSDGDALDMWVRGSGTEDGPSKCVGGISTFFKSFAEQIVCESLVNCHFAHDNAIEGTSGISENCR